MDKERRPQVMVERQENICGSTAGAGSGEFHNYRIQRRRERARISHLEREAKKIKVAEEFEQQKQAKINLLEEKTKKKAEKRKNKELRKKELKFNSKVKKEAEKFNKFSNDGSFLDQFLKEKEGISSADLVKKAEESKNVE